MQGFTFEKEETLSFIDFLKRVSGSKKVFTFMLWLIFLWAAKPDFDTILGERRDAPYPLVAVCSLPFQ